MAISVGLGYTGWINVTITSFLSEELRKERKNEIEKGKRHK